MACSIASGSTLAITAALSWALMVMPALCARCRAVPRLERRIPPRSQSTR